MNRQEVINQLHQYGFHYREEQNDYYKKYNTHEIMILQKQEYFIIRVEFMDENRNARSINILDNDDINLLFYHLERLDSYSLMYMNHHLALR